MSTKTLFLLRARALRCPPPSCSLALPLRAPVQKLPVARTTAPDMMMGEEVALSSVAAAGTLLATSAGDFGGYTIPVIGLTLLGAIIGILAGPVED